MSIKGLLKSRWGREGGGEGLRSKNLAGKEPSRWSPPGETHCLQNKQCNEKDKGGLRSGWRHEMTHKHAGPHPPGSPPLTSSAPSCESPPLYLQPGLRRAARGSCSSSGACRTGRSYPSRGQTASPRSSRIWGGGEGTAKQKIKPAWVECFQRWLSQSYSCKRVWLLKYNFPHSKAKLCCFFHVCKWSGGRVIMGHMNISSECSKMARIIIGMSIRLPPTLRQEEISLTPHQWRVCLHWKNICFIVISTDLSHATLHNMIKSSSQCSLSL